MLSVRLKLLVTVHQTLEQRYRNLRPTSILPVDAISGFMYTYLLVALLIGVGLYFFIRTRALPLRLHEAIRVVTELSPRKARSPVPCTDGVDGLGSGRRATLPVWRRP